ncbi:hypothetical protein RHA1_ro08640 (plasmid) [Rhodococcus jostii RHA1]|uniref:Uncharacterized protein n=1 Tax=Rhodococcus jostii (strain RHA1) TaxID=101510 RepID=Q0RYF2_RHOJR|nr:hypothetical protein RHA1_ro08640 [Rhodococcus jostii RHA1]
MPSTLLRGHQDASHLDEQTIQRRIITPHRDLDLLVDDILDQQPLTHSRRHPTTTPPPTNAPPDAAPARTSRFTNASTFRPPARREYQLPGAGTSTEHAAQPDRTTGRAPHPSASNGPVDERRLCSMPRATTRALVCNTGSR